MHGLRAPPTGRQVRGYDEDEEKEEGWPGESPPLLCPMRNEPQTDDRPLLSRQSHCNSRQRSGHMHQLPQAEEGRR